MPSPASKDRAGQQLSLFGLKPTKFQLELPKMVCAEIREISSRPKQLMRYGKSEKS